MMDGIFMLLALSTVMALASFLAGCLPLSFSLSQRQLRFIFALGTGVLAGTSLIVIIPEGVEALYSAGEEGHTHASRSIAVRQAVTLKGPALMVPSEAAWSIGKRDNERAFRAATDGIHVQQTLPIRAPASTFVQDHDDMHKAKAADDEDEDHTPSTPSKSTTSHREPHAYVGVSLIFGFILMYLIDTLPSLASSLLSSPHRARYISLANLSRTMHSSSSPTFSAPSSPPPPSGPTQSGPSATTIGLVIHACADGIALGASSTTSSHSLSLVIFLAIMLHKAPAAFGLTSVLLKQGLSKRTARMHLVIFSLAAPVGAIGTWLTVGLLGWGGAAGDEGMKFATGCVLLFSGGTFLYVAMHSMNETSSSHSHGGNEATAIGNGNGYANAGYMESYGSSNPTSHDDEKKSFSEVMIAVVGMLLPLLTQIGHAHAHG